MKSGSEQRPPSPLPTPVSKKSGSEQSSTLAEFQSICKSTLKRKFQCLIEGAPNQGETRFLYEIYTELQITVDGKRGSVNDEHEVRQIECASWGEIAQGRPTKCSDIFKLLPEAATSLSERKAIRTVLTKGVAGIGKTVCVHKFILDWAEGIANHNVHFIFPLSFRELNLIRNEIFSLGCLIDYFFPEVKYSSVLSYSAPRSIFIFDGLDECQLPLNFHSTSTCRDVTKLASVDVLLTNLIKGDLLPSALIWITTRPAAANKIPPECVDQVTEITGFSDAQKEEYFRKRICDEYLASRTITHLKSSRSLYIMCHIPIFCWITATVLKNTLAISVSVEIPRTLTQIYTHFLIIQTCIKNKKYTEEKKTDEEVIFKLGKLAFQQLGKGNLIFYEEDLGECGIDVTEALVYSGVCTQIFREEINVFSFVHLSIQEFLAALYVFLCFSNRERNMPDQQQPPKLSALFRAATLHDLHKTAVDLALSSENRHLDIFLRFLLGLSLESSQNLLMHLLPQMRKQSQSSEQTVQYVKQKIRDNIESNIKRINLFYCLNELYHHAVVDVIDRSSGTVSVVMLLPGQQETRKFEFKVSKEQLDKFDLQKYIKTPGKDQTRLLSPDEVLQRVIPEVTSALLNNCKLTEKSCSYLASALTSHSSSLRQLNLSENDLQDSGVDFLCSGLCHQNCKLEELQLNNCKLTEKSCSYLASALTSHSSTLRQLDLSENDLQDSGVKFLCSGLCHQNCKLEELQLERCSLTESSCAALASAASSSYCKLKKLNLSNNYLHDAGVQHLSSLCSYPHFKLEKLVLERCSLTESSCAALASAASSAYCRLKELNLSNNYLHDAGVQHLSSLCSYPHFKLEKLVLRSCSLTEKSCAFLSMATCSLIELNLSGNEITDAGALHLSDILKNPDSKLQKLVLRICSLTEKSCATLAIAASSTFCSLKELNLSFNKLYDAGVQHLSDLLKSPHCKLEKLVLRYCFLTEKSCAALASAAKSTSFSLKELDVSDNKLHEEEVQHLSDLMKKTLGKLEKLLEGHHSTAPQRNCESCAEVPDSSHWVVVKPEVSTEKSISTYSLSSPAGSYECSKSGLRWSCAASVSLQYRFIKEELFWTQLQNLEYRPAGPLMDIKLLSGKLEEIHLPHFLCLGGSDLSVLGDMVRALHSDDSNTVIFSLETCNLTRFHARIPVGRFSLWQLVKRALGLAIRSHCEVLIYQSRPRPLILNTFLVPTPSTARHQVEDTWKCRGACIPKPPPDDSLCVNSKFQLSISGSASEIISSEITPSELTLSYKIPQTYFEVCLKNPPEDFKMELRPTGEDQTIWKAVMRQGADYHLDQDQADPRVSPQSHSASPPAPPRHSSPAQTFFSRHKAALSTRLPSPLTIILIELQQRKVLNELEWECVEKESTSTGKNHVLLTMIQKKGAQELFYEVLKKADPHLMEDLEAHQGPHLYI